MYKLVTAGVLAALLASPVANANDVDKLIGAAAGAAIGSTIGKGDGRTVAMAAGAVIGASLADDGRRKHYRHRDSYDNGYYQGSNGIIYSRSYDSYSDMESHFYRQCRNRVPERYDRNYGARRAWISGCVNRKIVEQREYENEAYHDGSREYRRRHHD